MMAQSSSDLERYVVEEDGVEKPAAPPPEDTPPVDIGDFPKPVPITVDDMIDQCIVEALRIRGTQTTLIAMGHRTVEDPGMIRKAEVWEAQARFLQKIKPRLPDIRKMMARR